MVERQNADENLERLILERLERDKVVHDTHVLGEELKINHTEIDKVLKSLNADEYISLSIITR